MLALISGQRVMATQYEPPDPGRSLIGELEYRTLVHEDTFAQVARREDVGYEALKRANPLVDDWVPGEGTTITLPKQMLLPDAPRQGVVINLSELRLFYFDEAQDVINVFPIGIGSEGRATPVMQTKIIGKIENPVWYPPASVRARHAANGNPLARSIAPGPDNPLGRFALQLARRSYFIHGTNQPIGVGRRVSAGCIRLFEADIEKLVRLVSNGTPVNVIKQPYKVGWHKDALYLEAHSPEEGTPAALNRTEFVAQVIKATQARQVDIDWPLAMATVRTGSGLPVRISR